MSKSKVIKKSRMGRPPIANPATEHIHLRVTPDRKAAYERAANPGKLSEWIFKLLDKAAGFTPTR